MKRIGTLVLAVCVAAFASSAASAGAAPGSWYISPQVNALWLDDGRVADDDAGVTLALGRVVNENWDVELSIFGSEHDRAGGDTLELQGFGLSTKRVFYRDGRVNPFLSLGLGRIKTILKPGADEEDLAAMFGAGVLVDLGPSRDDGSAMQLRADIGARRGLTDNEQFPDAVDYVAGLGIQYSWGGSVTRLPVDTDGDGVTDDLDKCPGTPTGTPVDSSGCPLPQDDDGDGVINENDKCPGTPAGKKVDAVGCEIDGDDDGDGILNSVDQCPDSPKGTRVNNVGCPFDRTLLLQGVKFETNKDTLLPESIPILDNAIATLKRYPEVNIEVQGHTDSRGSDAYNMDLSARRAATVLEYLRDGGVTNQLTSRGYGETDPIASNDTDEGRQQNRRVILYPLN
ncbi:MAG TPA: OmpA family protein [Steroidobacteraceae bacterium]|jgi:OOP family OmpA-OmpF porin|nr:OmpA family protein [Steroidobacteraceae bacterium]